MGIINAFGAFLSPAIYLTVLSFVAYVVGMITSANIKSGDVALTIVRRFLLKSKQSDKKRIDQIVRASIKKARQRKVKPFQLIEEFEIDPYYTSEEDYDIHRNECQGDEDRMLFQQMDHAVKQLQPLLSEAVIASIPTLAIKLQEKNKDLFDNYDKDKSEAEFRLSIAGPLAVLTVQVLILSWGNSDYYWPWASLVGLIAVVMLVVRGLAKRSSATNVVITALEIGTIESSELSLLANIDPPPAKLPMPRVG
ncbi:hypothetical protein GCM10017711_07350 [Paeniglutamicibacter sulfureus]